MCFRFPWLKTRWSHIDSRRGTKRVEEESDIMQKFGLNSKAFMIFMPVTVVQNPSSKLQWETSVKSLHCSAIQVVSSRAKTKARKAQFERIKSKWHQVAAPTVNCGWIEAIMTKEKIRIEIVWININFICIWAVDWWWSDELNLISNGHKWMGIFYDGLRSSN